MANAGIPRRLMLGLMISGVLTCLLILLVLYIERGRLDRKLVIAVAVAYALCCLLLLALNRVAPQRHHSDGKTDSRADRTA
jgi:hypothetical protein